MGGRRSWATPISSSSRWAEGYEREQGHIRCPQRVENNPERDRGEWVRCASTKPGRYHRGPGRKSQIRRRQVPAAENPRDVSVVVERVDEQKKWRRVQADRRECYWKLEPRCCTIPVGSRTDPSPV